MPKDKVVNKYFSTESVMDESLSDFQEKKKYNVAPKNIKKNKNAKKPPKRAKGQKDIRALIKQKESEVVSYSRDFDKVCKQTDVDIDSEELQLAIALSKSLNEVQSVTSTASTSTQALTSEQRTLKLKATLQEYGFRIGSVKITSDKNKRKRHTKHYKLLQISDAERQQIISDKYSEVLVVNINKSPLKVPEQCQYTYNKSPLKALEQSQYLDKELYYKATNIAYDYVKDDDIYYVKDLFVKPCNKTCQLRDWSEIPGRPLSPTVDVGNINFDNITFTQSDLDCILSGTIFTAQQIVSNIVSNHGINSDIRSSNKAVEWICNKPDLIDDNTSIKTDSHTQNMSEYRQVRCVSPDFFDDEGCPILDCTNKNVKALEQKGLSNINSQTYCMDLTECVNVAISYIEKEVNTKYTNTEINITRRKSNDFMEMTDCICYNSKQINIENIDLTESSNYSNKQNEIISSQNENVEFMDLTQGQDEDPVMHVNHTEKNNSSELCFSNKQNEIISSQNENVEFMDLTQGQDEDPVMQVNHIEKHNSLDDTIVLVNDDFDVLQQKAKQKLILEELAQPVYISNFNNTTNGLYKNSDMNKKDNLNSPCKNSEMLVIINQKTSACPSEKLDDNTLSEKEKEHSLKSRFSDHIFNNADDIDYEYVKYSLDNSYKSSEVAKDLVKNQPDEIDLTQKSYSSNEDTNCNKLNNQPILHCLGKKGNISIDYDEIFDDIVKKNNSHSSMKSFECDIVTENGLIDKETNDSNYDIASNPSKNSEVFEISDKEFNYSLHQSKYDNSNFEGFCDQSVIVANNSNIRIKNNLNGTRKRSFSESNLTKNKITSPIKEVTQSQILIRSNESSTPERAPTKIINEGVLTPKNCNEYIIKTSNVTPMQDYASMSSPERHEELAKYGLKPFKRKRAIQLLTYIYNQTHPLVEPHDDDCPSPSKRQKKNDGSEKFISPKEPTGSQLHSSDVNNSDDLYAVTNEQPDIRSIQCDAEDWVFQKREKAKVHSCKVPLHIAFHNYLSCRRRLREAVLRYEPVNIDIIHKGLVTSGYRYNPKDLLKFLDKKCITVRTADNNSRNRKS